MRHLGPEQGPCSLFDIWERAELQVTKRHRAPKCPGLLRAMLGPRICRPKAAQKPGIFQGRSGWRWDSSFMWQSVGIPFLSAQCHQLPLVAGRALNAAPATPGREASDISTEAKNLILGNWGGSTEPRRQPAKEPASEPERGARGVCLLNVCSDS